MPRRRAAAPAPRVTLTSRSITYGTGHADSARRAGATFPNNPRDPQRVTMNYRKSLAVLLLLSLTSTLAFAQEPAAGPSKAPKSNAHLLTNAEFDALEKHPESLVLVDVRRPDEVTAIGGFPVYLSIQLKELANSTAWIPKERTVVLVSNHAGRASRAADILSAKGFKVAGAIGAQTYEKAGGTIVHIPVPPPRAAGAAGGAGGEAN
jgi:rhodanese-related sulfurtransferase